MSPDEDDVRRSVASETVSLRFLAGDAPRGGTGRRPTDDPAAGRTREQIAEGIGTFEPGSRVGCSLVERVHRGRVVSLRALRARSEVLTPPGCSISGLPKADRVRLLSTPDGQRRYAVRFVEEVLRQRAQTGASGASPLLERATGTAPPPRLAAPARGAPAARTALRRPRASPAWWSSVEDAMRRERDDGG